MTYEIDVENDSDAVRMQEKKGHYRSDIFFKTTTTTQKRLTEWFTE